MKKREFFDKLILAGSTTEAWAAVNGFRAEGEVKTEEKPLGYRPNNRGTVEVATDPGRSVIERITNAIDALLELEHSTHNGRPNCTSPRMAAQAWLGIDHSGLSATGQRQRQQLARRTIVRLEHGEGKSSRVLTVFDAGIGLHSENMASTILSLNESNKWQKHYLAGTFGQGGSSTFAFSKISLIASRRYRSDKIGFTVVFYKDLPAEKYKSGHYVFLVDAGTELPYTIDFQDGDPLQPFGTLVRHFGYDLTSYPSPFGERRLYGAMNRLLFDPIVPIWFENKVDGWNRGIYGSRTRLNSGSDESEGGNSLELDHKLPMTSLSLGELGQIGIEYWLLPIPERKNTVATAAYVDHHKPIILSVNGQNQSELTALLIRKDADLPYLRNRLICHIDCDGLSSLAKRSLFSSTREQAKEGEILGRIRQELVDLLRSDDDLKRLNREAKDKSLSDTDEEAKKRVRKEVARMLTLMGKSQIESSSSSNDGTASTNRGRGGGYRKLEPLETREPPTFIRILHDDEKPIRFFPSQRRWLRIETDASADYLDPKNLGKSRINFIVNDCMRVVGVTSLKGGRMRIALECLKEATIGTKGSLRTELYRTGLQPLSDNADFVIVEMPKKQDKRKTNSFPEFELIKVEGPEDSNWSNISEESVDVTQHASRSTMSEGTLYIYYSAAFPKFDDEARSWATKDVHRAASFERRYEVWLAVHSLLLQEQEEMDENVGEIDDNAAEEFRRQERCRAAIMAAMVASQEVKAGDYAADDAEA